MNRNKNRGGFTLVEMMVTLAVVGIMAAIAVPSMAKILPRIKLRSATSQLANDLQAARYRGISGNFRTQIVFNTVAGTYTRNLDTNRNGAFEAGEADIVDRTMPSGVNFVPGSTAPNVTFDPTGSADDGTAGVGDILVTLVNTASPPETRQLSVNRAMGLVKAD